MNIYRLEGKQSLVELVDAGHAGRVGSHDWESNDMVPVCLHFDIHGKPRSW